ncbi:hypothetical protein [Spiroplasma monobiae]|uniref:Uncharacterized protein n=1 Tax=Spiroplasma monobiae MQ-1 TaxID=1336748 RepID=A0A2K9LVF4_SPISQ|nr:hypothetical protein [Spiroplasma monobiae]AUM63018.1 hypothetical protein SMONO_v1c07690 [Spiroplasma monobiae MQ-1]
MYVNPFERMRKQREEEDKKRNELEKEREKYARLGAQMGFTDDKAVVPSFIKTLIGETNQSKVPPFGMAMDNDFDNMPESDNGPQPTAQASNRTMEDFEKQFGSSESQSSFNSTPVFGNNEMSQNNMTFQQNGLSGFGSSQPAMPDFENNHSFGSSQPAMPEFENNHSFGSSQPAMPDFENISTPQNNHQQNFAQEQYINSSQHNDDLILQNSFDEKFESFFDTDEVDIFGGKIINTNEFSELNQRNELSFKNILLIDNQNLINELQMRNIIEIDLSKVILYSSPCLFMLKRFINNLPEIISLDDKRTLWERASLLLAATEWGKTGSEIDYILEELNLTADPMGMFIDEFSALFESYNFNEEINILLSNSGELAIDQVLFINEFISNLIMNIPGVSCVLSINSQIVDMKRIEEILENYDYVVSDDIVLQEPVVQEQVPVQQKYEEPQINNFQEIQQPISQPQINNFQQEQQTFQQPSWESPEPVKESRQESSLDNFFGEELKGLSSDIFERPEENDIALTYDKEDNNFTGNIPGITNSNFTDTHSNNQLPGFAKNHQEQEQIEEEEEDYDPGIDSNLRIHVDQVLEAKKNEILEQEKREEQDRLERKGESGFDPSIISKKEVVLNPYANPFEGMNLQSPLSARNEKLADPRPRNEIEGKLKEMNSNLAGRRPINIEESFANDKNKDKDKKLISVPGNWEELKN